MTLPNSTAKGKSMPDVKFGVDMSRGFTEWLETKNVSLALTTYQVRKLIMFGVKEDGGLWSYNRNIGRCMGMAVDDKGFWVTSDTQLLRFENLLNLGELGPDRVDALYAPRFGYFTGDLDAHDVTIGPDDEPIFANTLFNCVSRPSRQHSFEVEWTPPFISKLMPEDRCHLNGIAMRDGKLRYVTAVSQTDVFDGWRDHRRDGGIVIDTSTNEIICSGLSMPHSPRWHEDRLWLHNSGTGQFGFIDLEKGKFEPVAFCPGYLRGLSFIDENTAVVGLSLPRDNKTFSGLALEGALEDKGISPKCGLYFIDLKSGSIIHSMSFNGVVTELYDVVVLPGIKKPALLGPESVEVKRTLSIPTISNMDKNFRKNAVN
jgi:uncharacterized protein (TIGR03032 family)